MFKTLKNKLVFTIVIILLILGGFSLYFFKQYIDYSKFKKIAESEFVGKQTKMGDFSDTKRWNETEKEFVLTKLDFQKPVYTYITHYGKYIDPAQDKKDSKQFQVIVIYFERTGLDSLKVIDFNQNTIYKTTWDKSIQSAKETDLSKVNDYKDQEIRHLEPKSVEQITEQQQSYQKALEKQKQKDDNDRKLGILPFDEYIAKCLDDKGISGDVLEKDYRECQSGYYKDFAKAGGVKSE